MRNTGIAAEIEADLLRENRQRGDITKCFQCGHGMMDRGSRFCSDRCRDFYDAGNAGHAQDWLRQKPDYGITGHMVIAGPPGTVIGSDYYVVLRYAFERRKAPKAKARAKRNNKVPNYVIKADGHGYWQPSTASRALGFKSVDCGFDSDEARSKARGLNEAASAARKARSVGENIVREAA